MNKLQTCMQEKLSDEEKIENIAHHFREILKTLGLDTNQESIEKTPERVAKMYVKELFSGLKPENFPKLSFFHKENISTPVFIKNISISSICEHHFLPMVGTAHIAYIPSKNLIGLSKINRIAQYFAKRPQIQERLTTQIGDCLSKLLQTENVAVFLELNHFCVTFRGISDINSTTQTEYLRGAFKSKLSLKEGVF